jgi:hypothetical protein
MKMSLKQKFLTMRRMWMLTKFRRRWKLGRRFCVRVP